MSPEKYKIPLIMQCYNLSSHKLGLLRQHTLEKPRNSHSQPRRKIIQDQLRIVTRRIPMARNLRTTLYTADSKPRTGTIR